MEDKDRGKTTSYKHIPRLTVKPSAGPKRHVIPRWTPQREASTSGAVPQGQGPLPDTPATVNVRAKARPPLPRGSLPPIAQPKMPHSPKSNFRFATLHVQKIDGGDWDLADAISRSVARPATMA